MLISYTPASQTPDGPRTVSRGFGRGLGRFVVLSTLTSLAVISDPAPAGAQLRAVASVPDLAAIAAAVGGARVEVSSLAVATQDPHFVDARPHLALELSRADVLLVVGLDLEVGWLPPLLTGARNSKVQPGAPGYLDCSSLVPLLEIAKVKLDRSMGDIHPGGNPHYLYDPRAAARVAQGIASRFASLDPAGEKEYQAGAARFVAELAAVRVEVEQRLASARGAPIITYHKTAPYLADWLGLDVVEHLEPKPGIPPNPQHVAHVLAVARSKGVRMILVESYYPRTAAELIAEKSGARVVGVDGATSFATGETYPQHVRKLGAALASALVGGGS